MIKAGIIGATGYAGGELVRLLSAHREVEIVWLGSKSYTGESFSEVYQNFQKIIRQDCKDDDITQLADLADVVFTATPQGFCASKMNEDILSKVKVIDLSADYRIKDVSVYEKWYEIKHASPGFISEAVYGLCEVNREQIKKSRLVANPGCYTTCSILTLYPLVKAGMIDTDTLIIDAKSGTSGAGRGAKTANLFCEVNENIKAYGIAGHRHTPEIEEQLTIAAGKEILISFTPHLVPMNRGILVTAYGKLKEVEGSDGRKRFPSKEEIREAYLACYRDEQFIRLLPEGFIPETKWVKGSNYVDINFVIDERTNRLIMVGALDNLMKGAASQAVQNMNLMFGLPEHMGVDLIPMMP